MLYKEFTERTNVQVSPEEFAQIHADYMRKDWDKDKFCAIWCELNKDRVLEAKALREVAERKQRRIEIVFDAFDKLCMVDHEMPCTKILSVSELIEIESCGIEISYLDGCEPKPKRVLEIRAEIHNRFGWLPL